VGGVGASWRATRDPGPRTSFEPLLVVSFEPRSNLVRATKFLRPAAQPQPLHSHFGSKYRYRYRLPITVSRGGSTSFERLPGVITSDYQRGSVFCICIYMRAPNRLQRSVQGLRAQHPLWAGLRRRRQKAEQADRGPTPPSGGGVCSSSQPLGLAPAWLCSLLSLSARRRLPNFLGLRRSTRFGLACGAEGRNQSKRIEDNHLSTSFWVVWCSSSLP
jgi:hypothetical protein